MHPLAKTVLRRFLLATEISISPELERAIDIVADYFKGSKRAKFLASIQVLRDSIAQGAWIPRGKIKAQSGFYQGLSKNSVKSVANEEPESHLDTSYQAQACIRYGEPYHGKKIPRVDGVPEQVIAAWIHCCNEAKDLSNKLDKLRPPPTVTPVDLSPKVTKTLTEMNLDIDLSTVRPAKIVTKERQERDPKTHELMVDHQGKPIMERYEVVEWTPGIKMNQSRFHVHNGTCEACGKRIPSGLYVPIEAKCRNLGLVGLWVGTDCARNIFGIKDQGVERVT